MAVRMARHIPMDDPNVRSFSTHVMTDRVKAGLALPPGAGPRQRGDSLNATFPVSACTQAYSPARSLHCGATA
jgi:hypothetical protein